MKYVNQRIRGKFKCIILSNICNAQTGTRIDICLVTRDTFPDLRVHQSKRSLQGRKGPGAGVHSMPEGGVLAASCTDAGAKNPTPRLPRLSHRSGSAVPLPVNMKFCETGSI